MTERSWDAASYDRVGTPMTEMAVSVLDRIEFRGDERVLDAGCGTGQVSELLLDLVPKGRVLAVDADVDMVGLAAQRLQGRAEVYQTDLLELELEDAVDVIVSTATFHWVLDHEGLFSTLFDALRPGGRLVAQCGGEGNIAKLRAVADEVADEDDFQPHFAGWTAPWYYAGVDETAKRLEAAGFTDVRTWLEPWPVEPEDSEEYMATVTLGAQVQHLPEALRDQYVAAVLDRLEKPVTVDYVRLNIDARRPA